MTGREGSIAAHLQHSVAKDFDELSRRYAYPAQTNRAIQLAMTNVFSSTGN